jgi:hypothetical protein
MGGEQNRGKDQAGQRLTRQQKLAVLVPVAGVAFIAVLVVVIVALTGPSVDPANDKGPRPRRERPADLGKLADGSSPGDADNGLQDLDMGLKYRDIKVGDGAEVKKGATVTVDYTGWLLDGGKMFDTSWKPGGTPMTSPLNSLVAGWQLGVPGMKVGGIRKLVIPAGLGYGETGSPPDIPPNADLVFEIEVLAIK